MRSLALSIAAGLCLAMAGLCGAARAQEAETVRLTAKPPAIFADGATFTTITAEVRDRNGGLIPNGAPVRFSTTLGTIDSAATTQGGQASVRLTSSSLPGTATVTASSGHATAEVKVEFTSKRVVIENIAQTVSIRAKYLLYNDFEKVVDAAENVSVRIGSVEFHADRAQMFLERSTVVAESSPGAGALDLKLGNKHYAVDRLQYNWDSRTGMVAGITEPVRGVFELNGATSELVRAGGPAPADEFVFIDLTPSPLAIRASRVVYLPSAELQFTRAQIMLNGKRRISLPFHVMPVEYGRAGYAEYVGLGSRGPLLDLPYYVAASPLGTSQFRLKYNAPEGLYGATVPGWALDMLTRYDLGGGTDGALALTRITSPDRGLSLTHNQVFGPRTRGYLNLDTRSGGGLFGRYSLANISLSHQARAFSMNFVAFGSRASVSVPSTTETQAFSKPLNTGNIDLTLQSTPRPLPGNFGWTVGTSVGHTWLVDSVTDPANPVVVGGSSESVSGRLIAPTVRTRDGSVINASVGQGLSFGGGSARRSTLGTVTGSKQLGKFGSINLTYNYSDFGARVSRGTSILQPEKQTFTASINYYSRPRWTASAFATLGLDQKTQNFRISGQYLFSDVWAATVNAGIFRQGLATTNTLYGNSFRAVNIEAKITRLIGERSLSLVYSTFHHKIYLDYVPGRYF